jgi:V/A-type H+-transporting ATPase subunit I
MLPAFLFIAIGVGFLQVVLGLCLGVYNGVRTKHWSHVYEKGGILAFVLGFVALIAGVVLAEALSSAAPWIQAAGGLTLFVGLIYAIRGGKILGAIESIGALTNIASYLRIMAVGLAGAIFADAVNGIAQSMGNPVLGIIVAIPLQALNFVVAAFSPNIHAVRLNFLEFFGKFYEGGDKDYKPFQQTGGEKTA